MILLKKIRLINWYAFANITAPIGFFTLIAGKNGNGKSVMLDAIKYAAYGDTVFNKSSESKGSRTLSSYTRGLLDATANTYMRPAEKYPNVYTHIALEYYDDVLEKPFVLGVVIETTSAGNYQTYRYVMDKKALDEVEHVYTEDETVKPYRALELQKRYGLTLMNREQGIPKFMQMTGLKLNLGQTNTYLRKLRSIMSYDPNAKTDRFIRESVLEEKNVDFTKLIKAKENIEQLNQTFSIIEEEIHELEQILEGYDTYENVSNRLLTDDVKRVYKRIKDLRESIEKQTREQKLAIDQKEQVDDRLEILNDKVQTMGKRLAQAQVSLEDLDCMKMIAKEKEHLKELEGEKSKLVSDKQALEDFQAKVDELLDRFHEWGTNLEEEAVLASLCSARCSTAEKQQAVDELRDQVEIAYDEQTAKMALANQQLQDLDGKLNRQMHILEDCRKHKNAYAQIPEYVGLRDEINREFGKRGIDAEARFACEYVIGLFDESWRDAIEAFLGIRRYTILVDPKYYDIADDVLNRSQYKYAHLFNTKLLMKKKTEPKQDSVVHMLDIRNDIAKKYFAYQLGRMHGVDIRDVKNYENAISKEGRVSVAMDSYFLRFEKLRFYYLGQKTFELNRIRAEREIEKLKEERKAVLTLHKDLEKRKNQLNNDKTFFRDYNYDAHQAYQKTAALYRESVEQLARLEQAQEDNQEYLELHQLVERLKKEQSAVNEDQQKTIQKSSELKTTIRLYSEKIDRDSAELMKGEEEFNQYKITDYTVVQKAAAAYEKYLKNDKKGPGGLMAEETRGRVGRSIEQHKTELIGLQSAYNSKHPGSQLPIGTSERKGYAERKDKVWMDNLQEIRQKLDEQTRRYEDIFKNEFVLTILKSCEKAQEDLKLINGELAKLKFSAKYEFDVKYVKDASEYAKIIEYAKYLDERERLGSTDNQMTLDAMTTISDEQGEQLEKDLKKIINRIIEVNSEETIARFADYRNYMTYEILITNSVLNRAKLSRQTGYNSGAEVQIPYLLILSSALLMIYNQRVNSTRLVFIDEPFAKMDPGNVKLMLDFMKGQNLQVVFCSPDKTETIGNECEVILPVLRVRADNMQLGIIQFHEEKKYAGL